MSAQPKARTPSMTASAESRDAAWLNYVTSATSDAATAAEFELTAIDVVDIAARVLVKHLLRSRPDLEEMVRVRGAAIVFAVPGPDWVDPIAEAWRIVARTTDDVPVDGDVIELMPSREYVDPWVEFRRDGSGKIDHRGTGNFGVASALSRGTSVYGFAPIPERHLPRDLMRVADLHIQIPAMDAAAFEEFVSSLIGTRPTTTLPDECLRTLSLDDLRLAKRPGQTPDDYVERLHRLTKSKVSSAVTLDDLHGMDEAAQWGRSLATDLQDYQQGKLPWSAVDKGALLHGEPGTGKTTFAKALAATCRVPLIASSLSQWQSAGHLGDTLKAMRTSFAEARAAAPCILFIDEIDSFGDRATFSHDNSSYSIQVVNGLLEELDGIGGREGVVVLGACNHPDQVDGAITRSGRLDRAILISRPHQDGLAKILRHHLKEDLPDVDLSGAARIGLGSTGADCERWVRGARRRARQEQRPVRLDDLLAEIRGAAPEQPAAEMTRCAVHEAGHALVVALERPGAVVSASIRQTENTGGGVITMAFGGSSMTRPQIESRIREILAGRAAEEVILGEVSSGAGGSEISDLARATHLATEMLCSLGLNEGAHGLLWLGTPAPDQMGAMLSLQAAIARQVSLKLAEAYEAAKDLIWMHRATVEGIAALLLEKESIDGREIEAILSETRGAKVRP